MRLSTVVLIVIRLFSVQWFVAVLANFVSVLPWGTHIPLLTYAQALVLPVFAVIAWLIAPRLSLFIVGKEESTIPTTGLTLVDLYAFAFVFLGLYFALGSLGNVANWLWYSFVIAAHYDFIPERSHSLYELFKPLVTFVAGLICLFSGNRWAHKLAIRPQQQGQVF